MPSPKTIESFFKGTLIAGALALFSGHYILSQDDPNDISDDKMGPTVRAIYASYKLLIDHGVINYDKFVEERLKKDPSDYVANSLMIRHNVELARRAEQNMDRLRADALNTPAPDMSKGLLGPATSAEMNLDGKMVHDAIANLRPQGTISENTATALTNAWIEATKSPVAPKHELDETNLATTGERHSFYLATGGILRNAETNYDAVAIQNILSALNPK